jgi:hypothetical protein
MDIRTGQAGRNPLRKTLLAASIAGLFVAPAALAAPGDPLGAAFRIDTGSSSGLPPLVARNASGGFVVVWSGAEAGDTGHNFRLYARVYAANGTPQTAPVAITPVPGPADASLAIDAAGNFVISWSRLTGEGTVIQFQRVSASGALLGGVTDVVTVKNGNSNGQAVAMDDDGDFVVAWTQIGDLNLPLPLLAGGYGGITLGASSVHAKRYSADGGAVGNNILVDISLTNPAPLIGIYDGVPPSVAMDQDGDFVVAWPDRALLRTIIKARRFDKSGLAAGLAFRVSPPTLPDASSPQVRMAPDGRFSVVYTSSHPVGNNSYSGDDIYLSRYSARGWTLSEGVKLSNQVVIAGPSLAVDGSGNLITAWEGTQASYCCDAAELTFQLNAADGTPRSANTLAVDGYGAGKPSVASDRDGNFVIVWNAGFTFGTIQARMYSGY